ncbi:MAG: peptidylprolyl isomerase [Oscillospiraceae bacterium]|nr:peptidylprolyl isomerase [Oscillospiraceae bacterium]
MKLTKKLLCSFIAGATLFAFTGCDDSVAPGNSGAPGSTPSSPSGGEAPPPGIVEYPAFNGVLKGAAGNVGNLSDGAMAIRAGDTFAVIRVEDFGDIVIALFPDTTPLAVNNFIAVAESGYYEGKIFHRIIHDFMIQGGSPNGDGMGSAPGFPEYATEYSPAALHLRGAISTANRGGATNGSQFFIVTKQNTDWLDGIHTVFGHMVEGFDVLDAIEGVAKGPGDKPVIDVVIESVTIHTYA